MKTNKKVIKLIIAIAITGVVYILSYCACGFCLSQEDSLYSAGVSGLLYGNPDGHVMYVKYIYALILQLFYRINPVANWYGIFQLLVAFISLFLLTYRVLETSISYKNAIIKLEMIFLFWCLNIWGGITDLNFTYISTMAGITAIYYFMTMKKSANITDVVIIETGISLCFWIRDEVSLIVLSFLALLFVCEFLKRERRKELLFIACGVIVIVTLTEIVEYVAYSSEKYKENLAYMNDLTVVYDYYVQPGYGECQDIYDKYEICDAEVELLRDGLWTVENRTNMHALYAELAEYVNNKKKIDSVGTFINKILETGLNFWWLWTISAYAVRNIIVLMLGIINMAISKTKEKLICNLLEVLLFALMEFYLLWRGRINDHAIIPLFIVCLTVQLSAMSEEFAVVRKENSRWITLLVSGVCIVGVMSAGYLNYRNSIENKIECNYVHSILEYTSKNQQNQYFTSICLTRQPNKMERDDVSLENIHVNVGDYELIDLAKEQNSFLIVDIQQDDILERVQETLIYKGFYVSPKLVNQITESGRTAYVYQFVEGETVE